MSLPLCQIYQFHILSSLEFNSCKCYNSSFRVATAQGKPGIWMFIFPDRENTGNLFKNIKELIFTQGNYLKHKEKNLSYRY